MVRARSVTLLSADRCAPEPWKAGGEGRPAERRRTRPPALRGPRSVRCVTSSPGRHACPAPTSLTGQPGCRQPGVASLTPQARPGASPWIPTAPQGADLRPLCFPELPRLGHLRGGSGHVRLKGTLQSLGGSSLGTAGQGLVATLCSGWGSDTTAPQQPTCRYLPIRLCRSSFFRAFCLASSCTTDRDGPTVGLGRALAAKRASRPSPLSSRPGDRARSRDPSL